jgi:putative spermidine/putrescine transport system ATP-binding protein
VEDTAAITVDDRGSGQPAETSAEPSGRSADEPPDVRLSGLRKNYGEVVAVAAVDLEIGRGEFFTMLGPSGSGKTTTLRMVAGFEQPDAGVVELAGRDVTGLPPYDREVNTVFQDYALFPHMTVAENVEYGMRVQKVPRPERARRASEALEMVRLPGFESRKPGELSGGQRQRVLVARALVQDAQLLLLDEPFSGLDAPSTERLETLIDRLAAEGRGVLIATHDVDQARAWDLVLCLNGAQIAFGPPAETLTLPVLERTYGGAIVELPGDAGQAVLPPHHHDH